MSLLHPYAGTETKAKEPLNEDLMDLKIRENLEDLAAQIDAISGGGSGGSGVSETDVTAKITSGGEDNVALDWVRRFHIDQTQLDRLTIEEEKDQDLVVFYAEPPGSFASADEDAIGYLGRRLEFQDGDKFSFKLKKGINFFGFSHSLEAFFTTSITVRYNGQSMTTAGVVDENGDPRPDTYSANSGTKYYQATQWFYLPSDEECVIEIENTDGGGANVGIDSIYVGYQSKNPTISNKVLVSAGKCSHRGASIEFDETELTFSESKGYGHTGAVAVSSAGTLTALDGIEPAMTQVKAEEAVLFGSGAPTELKVKNNYYFEDNQILRIDMPYGNSHFASYTSRLQTNIQDHRFQGMKWASAPSADYTPLNNFTGADGTATGDININKWAEAPIVINSTNNKIDFEITVNGTTTLHVATIDSGAYAADLVPVEKWFKEAMQTAKAINGEYFLSYSDRSKLWTAGVKGSEEVTEIRFLNNTGLNSGNSFLKFLGFADTDVTGKLSYIGSTEKNHKAVRVFSTDGDIISPFDPRVKASFTPIEPPDGPYDLEERLGLTSTLYDNTSSTDIFIYPDPDTCGVEVYIPRTTQGSTISVSIDNEDAFYLVHNDVSFDNFEQKRGGLLRGFISYPRGSRIIRLRDNSEGNFQSKYTASSGVSLSGWRQYYTKPAYEKLALTSAILKTYSVSPNSLYATIYGHNGGALYSPTGTDNIDTITETGSWFSNTGNGVFNNAGRSTSSSGAYVEVDFTLQGNGGGISLIIFNQSGSLYTKKASLFLSQVAINESTDRITNINCRYAKTFFDQKGLKILGLSAGTYTARFKNEIAQQIDINGVVIYDTVHPEENKVTINEVSGTGQSVTYPVNTIKQNLGQDGHSRIPGFLVRQKYREGYISNCDYSVNSPNFNNFEYQQAVADYGDSYYSYQMNDTIVGNDYHVRAFCKSLSFMTNTNSTGEAAGIAFIDGVQIGSNFTIRQQVKGGAAPTITRDSSFVPVSKLFKLSTSFSAGNTFTVSDTRGLRDGQRVRLWDGTNYEDVTITNIVVGTSFDCKEARSLVVDANVTELEFHGLHTMKIRAGTADQLNVVGFEWEVLTLTQDNAKKRLNPEREWENRTVTFKVANGEDGYYPIHSDGTPGDFQTSSIDVLTPSIVTSIPRDLRNIQVSAGTAEIKVTSGKWVQKESYVLRG